MSVTTTAKQNTARDVLNLNFSPPSPFGVFSDASTCLGKSLEQVRASYFPKNLIFIVPFSHHHVNEKFLFLEISHDRISVAEVARLREFSCFRQPECSRIPNFCKFGYIRAFGYIINPNTFWRGEFVLFSFLIFSPFTSVISICPTRSCFFNEVCG